MKGEGYVSQRDGGYWVSDTRVSLDSIVYAFLNGQTAESIAQAFPLLTLEQVYGAIAFYLGNQGDVEQDLAEREHLEEEFAKTHPAPPELKEKLGRARRHLPLRQS